MDEIATPPIQIDDYEEDKIYSYVEKEDFDKIFPIESMMEDIKCYIK